MVWGAIITDLMVSFYIYIYIYIKGQLLNLMNYKMTSIENLI